MARYVSPINGSASLPTLPRCSSSPCYRRMVVKMGQGDSYWASIETDIETHLKKVITIKPPLSVFEPMHYLTFSTPKTTAPALCIAACELLGGDRDQAMAAASAIHLMHAATYTHQHMHLTTKEPRPRSRLDTGRTIGPNVEPIMPDPARKNNSDKIFKVIEPELEPAFGDKFSPGVALLTADGLIPFGMELLAKAVSPARGNSDKILRVIVEVTRAIGSQGLIEGQFKEIEWTKLGNEKMLEYVCKKKEGELHACGAACGAILGVGSDEEVESLRNYGLYVGTMQGIIKRVDRNNTRMEKRVEELRVLAMKALHTSFTGKKVRQITSLVEQYCLVPHDV